jgi:hypothetical protein
VVDGYPDRRGRRVDVDSPAYRGSERRQAAAAAGDGRHLDEVAVAMAAILLLTAGCALVAPWRGAVSQRATSGAAALLSGGLAITCFVISGVFLLRWQLNGRSRAATYGVGFALVGLQPALLGATTNIAQPTATVAALGSGALLAGLALLGWGFVGPLIDTRYRIGRVIGAGVALAVLAAAASDRAAGGGWVGMQIQGAASGPRWPSAGLGVLLAVSSAVLFAARRRSPRIEGWIAVALASWSGALAVSSAGGTRAAMSFLPSACAIAGALVCTIGLFVGLAEDFAGQRGMLFEEQLSRLVSGAERRATDESEKIRRHDARNVLLTVQTAGLTLQRKLDALSEADRHALADILRSGVNELNEVVGTAPESHGETSLAVIERRLAPWAFGAGVDLVSVMPAELTACGTPSQLVEALRLLVGATANADPGRSVAVCAEACDREVTIRVRCGSRPGDSVRAPIRPDDPLDCLVATEIVGRQGGRVAPGTDAEGRRMWTVRLARPGSRQGAVASGGEGGHDQGNGPEVGETDHPVVAGRDGGRRRPVRGGEGEDQRARGVSQAVPRDDAQIDRGGRRWLRRHLVSVEQRSDDIGEERRRSGDEEAKPRSASHPHSEPRLRSMIIPTLNES